MYDMFSFAIFIHDLLFLSNVDDCNQDFLGDDFKSQGSHVPYNVTDFSTQVPQEPNSYFRPCPLVKYFLFVSLQ